MYRVLEVAGKGAKATGKGIVYGVRATAKATAKTLNPEKGERKTRIVVLLTILFFSVCMWAMYRYQINIVDTLKILADFFTKVLGIFGLSNGVEHISAQFGGKENTPPIPPAPAPTPAPFPNPPDPSGSI